MYALTTSANKSHKGPMTVALFEWELTAAMSAVPNPCRVQA